MNDQSELEQILRDALRTEAADVDTDPHALERIQSRTRRDASPSPGRRWRPGAWTTPLLIAGAAAATVVGVVAVVDGSERSTAPPVAGSGTTPDPARTVSPPPTVADETLSTEPRRMAALYVRRRVYFVSKVDGGLPYRVFSEPQLVASRQGPGHDIAPGQAFLDGHTNDPDYYNGWPSGVRLRRVTGTAGNAPATVQLSGSADLSSAHGLSPEEADASIDAFVRSVHAGSPVRIHYNGEPLQQLLGRRISGTAYLRPASQSLNPVQITRPLNGHATGKDIRVTGEARSYEANVSWRLSNGKGKLWVGHATASRSDQRSPWSFTLRNLPPGQYTLSAYEQSPEDGSVTYRDTKTFMVR